VLTLCHSSGSGVVMDATKEHQGERRGAAGGNNRALK